MRGAWPILLAALALAGCAGDVAPLVPAEGTLREYDGDLPGRGLAPLEWHAVSDEPFALSPTIPHERDVAVPRGTIQVLVNATLDAGAAYGLRVQLGGCTWQRELVLVAQGQTVGADCGGLLEGGAALTVSTSAGALSGRLVVAALVCDQTRGICPEPLPTTAD